MQRSQGQHRRFILLAGAVTACLAASGAPALARHQTSHAGPRTARVALIATGLGRSGAKHGYKVAYVGHRLQCVQFARADSGIELTGNAVAWWDEAAGTYQRGAVPEPGSVLSFSANGRMRLGHVAVVSQIVNPRVIEIDHANWWGPGARGGVARGVTVVDVSERNDWSAVRVALGRDGSFGSVYPTNGFIYARPDTGTMVAAAGTPTAKLALGAAPADLRARWTHARGDEPRLDPTLGPVPYDEVAEAPDDAAPAALHRHARRKAHHRRQD